MPDGIALTDEAEDRRLLLPIDAYPLESRDVGPHSFAGFALLQNDVIDLQLIEALSAARTFAAVFALQGFRPHSFGTTVSAELTPEKHQP